MAENDVYTVSTTLILEDRLTPAMRRAIAVARDLYKELDQLKALLADLGVIDGVAKVGKDLAEVNGNLKAATRNATLLGDELKGLSLPPGLVAGSERFRRSLGAAERRAMSLRDVLSGIRMPHLGANLPTGIGAAVGYGVYREAEIQHFVNKVMLAANESILGPNLMVNSDAQRVRQVIRDTSSTTGMSATEAGEALMPVILQMGALPLDKRLDIAPLFEKFAFVESALKGVQPAEAASSLVGLLHMTGSYDPEAMKKLAASTAFVSTISPMGLPQIERTASYVMPSALTAGIDPSQLLLVLAQAQSAGVSSTKAGTWFNDLFLSLSPKGGFASLISTKAGQKRVHAMEELGLVKNGKNVGLDMLEHGKWTEFSKMIATAIAKVPEDKRLGLMSEAMGSIQAARALNLMAQPSFTQNLPQLELQQSKFLAGGLDEVIKKLGEGDPTIEFRKVMADFTNALMDLGKVVLPPLTKALSGLDDTLKKLIPSIPGANGKPFDIGDMGTAAAAGAAVGGKIGGLPGAGIGAIIGAATIGSAITQRQAIEAGVIIDPTGMGVPFNLNAPAPTPDSHGAGKLGEWFDRTFMKSGSVDWSKLNPAPWLNPLPSGPVLDSIKKMFGYINPIGSAYGDERPGGIGALSGQGRPGTSFDPSILKTLNADLAALGLAETGASAAAKAARADMAALGLVIGGTGSQARGAVGALGAFNAAIARTMAIAAQGAKQGGGSPALPNIPGGGARRASADGGAQHAELISEIRALRSSMPAKVVMDGRVVGQLVGDRIDRGAAHWPSDRDSFDPGQMPPSAGSGAFYNT